jgi:hypothetical protein
MDKLTAMGLRANYEWVSYLLLTTSAYHASIPTRQMWR